ncbi:cytochrome P450 [Actinoplanes sp. NPDC051470]|uniref:cytochrome P450 n=1 Tax=Actinoplanes sp. NPDC051470 TaxID=3157224 RepID=UPI00343C44A8
MSQLPPGSRLPALVQSVHAARDPLGSVRTLRRAHGPIFTRRLISEAPQVVVADVAAARQVFADPTGAGLVGCPRKRLFESVVGEHSLFTMDGPAWERHHRLLAPALQGRAIEAWRDTIAEITDREIAGWPAHRAFPLHRAMQRIALEVIVRLVWGARLPERRGRLRVLAPRMLDRLSLAALVMPPRVRDRMLTANGFTDLRERLDEVLFAEITDRRRQHGSKSGGARGQHGSESGNGRRQHGSKRGSGSGDGDGDGDMLSRLVGEEEDDQAVRDEMVTLLLAGHETTAAGLAWAFERLLRTPRVWERLRDEPEDEEFLQAVVRETLRIRPVALTGHRRLVAPMEILGYEIPAGCSVLPMIRLIHQDPAVFPDPAAFRPDRFLGDEAGPAMRAWLPFGHGARYCVGARLAMLTMRTVISRVAASTDLAAPDPRPESQQLRQVTVTPGSGTRAVARPRRREPLFT